MKRRHVKAALCLHASRDIELRGRYTGSHRLRARVPLRVGGARRTFDLLVEFDRKDPSTIIVKEDHRRSQFPTMLGNLVNLWLEVLHGCWES